MVLQEMVFPLTKSETGETTFSDVLRSEGWRKIVAQVESALCREGRSREALDQLQQLATEQGPSIQFLVKSVIQETIRFTLECFGDTTDLLKRIELSPVADLAENPVAEKVAEPLTPAQKEAQNDATLFTAIAHVLKPVKLEKSLLHRILPQSAPPKLSPEALLLAQVEARDAKLLDLCHQIRHHRSTLGLSLNQIHSNTLIPLHHLQSFEDSKIDRLPEDVYLYGFLRRLEKCFALTEGQLTYPVEHQVQRSIVSKAPSIDSSPPSMSPRYAYIAYAALMAGGVYWITQQGSPKSTLPPLQIDKPAPSSCSQKASSQQTRLALTQNISRP
ncbi:MAG: helix-turn-helix domain-containing protein [Cyanobacteria bacterium]|nr:helix-turn-helix domain-containing protein [Cyanobacteriota bacterium]